VTVNRRHKRKMTVPQILKWVDGYHRRTGTWPHADSGPIEGSNGETWRAVQHALYEGLRGLPPGSSLARLLASERGVRNRADLPILTQRKILSWADAHHRHHERWPTRESGPVDDHPDETWRAVDDSLRYGHRGLPGGSSLARLLEEQRGVLNRLAKPRLTTAAILRWADAHRSRTGQWPSNKSGPIAEAPNETWKGVDLALRQGWRGLPRGPSLAQLLAEARKARNRANLPPLTVSKILTWADQHYLLTGAWPTDKAGPINDTDGETWNSVSLALRYGYRGLPGGITLARLLDTRRNRGKGS
jgi:hypothetical protein